MIQQKRRGGCSVHEVPFDEMSFSPTVKDFCSFQQTQTEHWREKCLIMHVQDSGALLFSCFCGIQEFFLSGHCFDRLLIEVLCSLFSRVCICDEVAYLSLSELSLMY